MPRVSPFASLEKSLAKLTTERQSHLNALARINALFEKFGIGTEVAGPAAAKRSGTAESVVALKKKRKRRGTNSTGPRYR